MKYMLNKEEVALALGNYVAQKIGLSGTVIISTTFNGIDGEFENCVVEITPRPAEGQ